MRKIFSVLFDIAFIILLINIGNTISKLVSILMSFPRYLAVLITLGLIVIDVAIFLGLLKVLYDKWGSK